ncbi:hypothetical protein [Cupriavidus sp. D39]|uniref:hypothetical protein n=1 Tax=Cupriavidus sp. D39 TaxID=2997877 RepID=UPI00226FFF26|nr:hypothetical protein [Cupriavidus sp. D39]MCY0853664.1 hypothetical protein [Cupriavidus sp. D39]
MPIIFQGHPPEQPTTAACRLSLRPAPLHAAALASRLGIRRVIVPQSAGVGSALGCEME